MTNWWLPQPWSEPTDAPPEPEGSSVRPKSERVKVVILSCKPSW